MAFPVVESSAAYNAGSSAATSHAVPLPATISAGALLVMVGRAAVAGAISLPAGWTVVQDSSDASDDVSFWAVRDTLAAGTEDGSTVTVTHGSGKLSAITYSITGAENPATQAPQTSTVAVGTGSNPGPTNCVPTGGAKDYLWLATGLADGEHTSPPTTIPANYGSSVGANTGTGGVPGTNTRIYSATRNLNAASEDAGTWTTSVAVNSGWTSWMIAIHPVGAATLFGAVVVALTATKAVIGKLTAKASSALSETVGIVTAGLRTTFGAASVAETVAVSTAGTVAKPGATSLALTAGVTTSGIVTAKSASTSSSVVGVTTAGTLTALGSTTLTETVAVGSAATRTTFAAAATAEAVTIGTAGSVDAKGATSLTETVAASTAGTRDTFAASSLIEIVAVTTAGDVSTGAQTHFGATSLSPVAAITTVGTLDAHAAAALTAALTATTTGTVGARSSSALIATVTITTAGNVSAGTHMGATSLSLTVAIHTGTGAFPAATAGAILYAPLGQLAGSRTGRIIA